MKKIWNTRRAKQGDIVLMSLTDESSVVGFYQGTDGEDYHLRPSKNHVLEEDFYVPKRKVDKATVLNTNRFEGSMTVNFKEPKKK